MEIPLDLQEYVHRKQSGDWCILKTNAPDLAAKLAALADTLTRADSSVKLSWVEPATLQRLKTSSAAPTTLAMTPSDTPIDDAIAVLKATAGRRVSDIHIVISPAGEAVVEFEIDGNLVLYRTLSNLEAQRLIRAFFTLGTGEGGNYSHVTLDQNPFPGYTYRGDHLPPHLFMIRTQFFTTLGQVLVIRLVETTRNGGILPITAHGHSAEVVDQLRAIARDGTGGIVITGEIGHGKTSLMYSLLEEDYRYREKIGMRGAFYTREQPPEQVLGFARQITIRDEDDWDAAHFAMLRGALKVGVTGEMRDIREIISFTKQAMIFKAYGTFHGATATDALVRFKEEGVPDRSLRNPQVFQTIISQRLLPVLCPHCSLPWVDAEDAHEHFLTPQLQDAGLIFAARRRGSVRTLKCAEVGCDKGFIGRRPVIEILRPTPELTNLLLESPGDGRREWLRDGNVSMAMRAWTLVRDGAVDPEYASLFIPLTRALRDFDDSQKTLLAAPAAGAEVIPFVAPGDGRSVLGANQ